MRRDGSQLYPIDRAIIRILDEQTPSGSEGVHGYELADRLTRRTGPDDPTDAGCLRSNGTVYKALHRLSRCGAISSSWEEADVALEAGRPRRRYYLLTENGQARARLAERASRLRARLAEAMSRNSGGRSRVTR
jgi:DNA-binding PadR family transcriptional regulator